MKYTFDDLIGMILFIGAIIYFLTLIILSVVHHDRIKQYCIEEVSYISRYGDQALVPMLKKDGTPFSCSGDKK